MPAATFSLLAHDVERANAFYRQLLGIDRAEERSLPVVFRRRLAPESSVAHCSSAAARLRFSKLSCLERALDVAWERGGRIVTCAQPAGRGQWRATIVDSEGNLVSLYARA